MLPTEIMSGYSANKPTFYLRSFSFEPRRYYDVIFDLIRKSLKKNIIVPENFELSLEK